MINNAAILIAALCNAANASEDNSDIASKLAATYLNDSFTSDAVDDLVSDINYYRDAIVRDNITSVEISEL